MSITLPTYIDLFGSEAEALSYYAGLFPNDTTPSQDITAAINTAYTKIDPIFGEFRRYEVGEETVRNEQVKRAVCFEANSIILSGDAPDLNTEGADTRVVTTDKIEDVSTSFSAPVVTGRSNLLNAVINDLGLLSKSAASLLIRYIRKTYTHSGRA